MNTFDPAYTATATTSAYSTERARAFELTAQIEQFQAYAPEERRRIREYVIEQLRKEAARGQQSHSALWRNAKAVYGIDPNDLEG